jgi:cobalt-zinc-cadmium efflux system membrane fusion protein
MSKTQLNQIIIVILIGAILGGIILIWDKDMSPVIDSDAIKTVMPNGISEGKTLSVPSKGQKGGNLFTTKDLGVEVTIFEEGISPYFRLYLYENSKKIMPAEVNVEITLTRLGAPTQTFKFVPEKDYLIGNQVVKEPHSFEMAITAKRNGKIFYWNYDQIEGRIEMIDAAAQRHGIKIMTAGPKVIKPTITLPGEIIFNHHTIVQVVPRMPGVVTSVTRHVGQQVRKSEVLAVIESPMLAELRSQYLIAQKRFHLAQKTFKREKQLWEEKITAKQDFLTAQEMLGEADTIFNLAAVKLRALGVDPQSNHSGKNLAHFEILAPISGLIISKDIAQGKTLKQDQEIFTIADVSTVWTALTAYPKDLNVIKVGQKVLVNATAFNVEGEGEITYISTLIGERTRTATVRVELDNKDEKWRPGMFVNAELATEETQVPVAVSIDAIQTIRNLSVVFGRYGEYFEIRPLELGRNDGKMVEVLKGLSAGEQYAAGNSFILKADLGKDGVSHDH